MESKQTIEEQYQALLQAEKQLLKKEANIIPKKLKNAFAGASASLAATLIGTALILLVRTISGIPSTELSDLLLLVNGTTFGAAFLTGSALTLVGQARQSQCNIKQLELYTKKQQLEAQLKQKNQPTKTVMQQAQPVETSKSIEPVKNYPSEQLPKKNGPSKQKGKLKS